MSDETKRLVIVYRNNLKMSRGKIAAQAVHAALAYSQTWPVDMHQKVVCLGLNEGPFNSLVLSKDRGVAIKDRGDTEVPRGTVTCLAFEDTEGCPFNADGLEIHPS